MPVWAVGFAHEQPLHVVALACSAFRILKRLQHNMSGLVLVSFEYAIEEEFFEEFTNPPPEEWFTWIYIFHKCAINEAYHLAFDYECA
jgi:hypothetical protein